MTSYTSALNLYTQKQEQVLRVHFLSFVFGVKIVLMAKPLHWVCTWRCAKFSIL